MVSRTAGPGGVIWNSTVWSSLATTSTNEFQLPLLRIHKMFQVPTTSLEVNAVPSLHVAPLGSVIVMTALTSGEYVTVGSAVGAAVGASVAVGTCVGTWVGASVGAGVAAAPHAFKVSARRTIRLNRKVIFLDMGFFSYNIHLKFEWNTGLA